MTEHIEGDETKFAVWTGRAPMVADYRVVLKAHNLETKQMWVKKLREVIQETYFSGASLTFPKSPAKNSSSNNHSATTNGNNAKNPSQRSSRDLDEVLGENDNDVSSLASFGSGNTTDSDKVSKQQQLGRCHTLTSGWGRGRIVSVSKTSLREVYFTRNRAGPLGGVSGRTGLSDES